MKGERLTFKLLNELKKDTRNVTAQLIAKHGDKFALKSPFGNLHIFSDPDLLKHVLLTNYTNYIRPPNIFEPLIQTSLSPLEFQEKWKKFRSMILHGVMNETAVKNYTGIIAKTTAEHLSSWEKYADTKKPFYVYPDLERMTLKNLLKAQLGDIKLDVEKVVHLIDELSDLAYKYELSLTKLEWKLPTAIRRRTNELRKEMSEILDQIVRYCLSDDVTDVTVFKDVVKSYNADYHDPNLSKDHELWTLLRAVASSYVTGGFDTLSRNLAITVSYLSTFPSVADNIYEEVKRVVGDGDITSENIGLLKYTRATFEEGLRFSGGILPLMSRLTLKDETIGNYEIKRNDRIMLPLAYMNHLGYYWDNPEGFDPTRFFKIDIMDERYRYVFVPFSAGTRGCSGRHFAALEGTIILALIARKYRVALLPHVKINPDNPGGVGLTLSKIS